MQSNNKRLNGLLVGPWSGNVNVQHDLHNIELFFSLGNERTIDDLQSLVSDKQPTY